jgi:hypothetical protein
MPQLRECADCRHSLPNPEPPFDAWMICGVNLFRCRNCECASFRKRKVVGDLKGDLAQKASRKGGRQKQKL